MKKKKEKKTFEQTPSGVYKEKPCDKCGDTKNFIPTARIWLCNNCSDEDEEIESLEDTLLIPVKLYSK